MATPITYWPGGGQPPNYSMPGLFGRMPMFGANQGPRYTGPANINAGSYGPLLQIGMTQMLPMLMGNSHMPAQFFPEQNVYDQMQANQFYAANQQAMMLASRRDTAAMENTIGGFTQMMTGKPLTDFQRTRNHKLAGGISQYMPLLTQVLGPDLVDQLHGSRGSATVFAQQFHQAMRTSIDPVRGTPGYTGESAGRLSQEVFEQMFGQGADIGALRGMSAGQAGMLVNELQSRGMLGRPMGTLPLQERRSLLPRELTSDVVNRLAEQLPDVQKLLRDGGTPSEEMLRKSRETIRSSHSRMVDPQVQLNQKDIENLPGGQEILRAGDANRIKQRLENLSGAVKAMRDIFGDMGNPNAPMREIVNGLEALTQGGMATMSPGELEMMVRRTQSIARQTGIGMEGMIAMTSQNAELADRLGLDRSFAVTVAQRSALFGQAAGDRLRLDQPAWGALTKEQLTLGDAQLSMHAAASPLANQLNAMMRLSDTGMASPAEGTELAEVFKAVRQGQDTYTFGGKTNDIVMPHGQLMRLLKRDAGVNSSEAYAVLSDVTGNQEYGQRYNTVNTVRRVQTDEFARRSLAPVLGSRIRNVTDDDGLNQTLQDEGVITDEKEFRQMMQQVGIGVSRDFFNIDSKIVRNTDDRQNALGQSFKNRLAEAIKAKMPNVAQEDIDAIVSKLVTQLGGEQGLRAMGTTIDATINTVAKTHSTGKSAIGIYDLFNRGVQDQMGNRGRQAEIEALTSSAMSGLGAADPVRRVMDVFQNAGPNTQLKDVLAQALGGVSQDAINAVDPNGGLAKVFGLLQENNDLDPNDPKQLENARRNIDMVRGLVSGGEVAATQLRALDASRDENGQLTIGNDALYKQMELASKRDSNTGLLGDLGYQLGANVSIDQVRATRGSGDLANKLLKDGKNTEETQSAIGTYVNGARERARQLLDDERSMQIIGRGGLELVQGAAAQSEKLQAMAAEQSKKLGRDVQVGELLTGGKGIDGKTVKEANELFQSSRTAWEKIDKLRSFGMLPGRGDDPANKQRAEMTAQEKEDLAAQQSFLKQYNTAESRAANVLDRLSSTASPEQAGMLRVDINREKLIKAIAEGDRGVALDKALHSRDELLEMGLKKGVFGEKTKVRDLTDKDKLSVVDKLRKADLSDDERLDVERMRKAASGVMDFGMSGMKPEDITEDLMKRARATATSNIQQQAPQDQNLNVKVTGSVTQRQDGMVDLSLEGKGIMDQIANTVGIV